MSLFIEEEGNIKLDFDTEEIATLVIDAALELADCPYEAEINPLLTENAQIHEMNGCTFFPYDRIRRTGRFFRD